ncbi:hypothetical protein G7Y89_g6592 [Cudoniella acicularis]|uniref:Ankyrin repeat protein n=1 Tax=Cudoniella acicularis TaxID=354080 RepID=A0A8H4RLM4_9HELO|nr:hypothetical protein G7Y89_g6592 [Cudoniella acicularis]
MTAAAYAKNLLRRVSLNKVEAEKRIIDIVSGFSDTLSRTEANVGIVRSKLDRNEDLKVLNWLTAVDYGPQHSGFLKRRRPEAGQWLLDSEEYQTWLNSDKQTLFCPGIPGAGKTILTATVIDDLSTKFQDNADIGIAYFYFNYKKVVDKQNVEDLLFLLAQLHLNSLIGKRAPKATRAALQILPTGTEAYEFAYNDAMERIEGQGEDREELAKQVLSWIICANRPLNTSELRHAFAVEVGQAELDMENPPEIEDMVSVCARLVAVGEESRIIRLVHYTTPEYFKVAREKWFPNAEIYLATIYLYDYASRNWGHHTRAASAFIPEVNGFLEKKAQVEASSQALLAGNGWQRYRKRAMTGLQLAAYFGVELVKLLFVRGANVREATSEGRTPLLWASGSGHIEVVWLLLEKGADINTIDISSEFLDTPFIRASDRGHVDVTQLLLEKGVDVNADILGGQTPLLWASGNGHIKIVWLLLEKGADINEACTSELTPLFQASYSGHIKVVWLLLEKGPNANTADINRFISLPTASDERQVDITKLPITVQEESRYNSRG